MTTLFARASNVFRPIVATRAAGRRGRTSPGAPGAPVALGAPVARGAQVGRGGRAALGLLAACAALSSWAVGRAWSVSTARHEPMQDSLSEDSAWGRVLDREGGAARRGALDARWSGIEAGARLEPRDWLRTSARGANALHLALADGAEVVLGPGAQVELTGAQRLRLDAGELALERPGTAELVIEGPAGASQTLEARGVVRARESGLERLSAEPKWLSGWRDNASTEALGSLLCQIDGRNVPLTMGVHQVTIDVRDQLARTVIEETFENHTDTVLEGVFYFPLPADASISGFGMWIGNELVQGEIVEKERAREIYETILREKRDPGLLEWSGGNVFKARVYPITSEKRIRIAYTQVLPKSGDTCTLRYALSSDLLRQHPLRELSLAVHVQSTDELVDVRSPSHACRVQTTAHAAEVAFEAQEYAPQRDFELAIRSTSPARGITAVQHRRADDGYFMLLLDAPPAPRAQEAAPRPAAPLDVIVVADTSGSMAGAPRQRQLAFLDTFLAALSDADTLNLVTADAQTRWAFDAARANSSDARQAALGFLEAREPLGWTDLDRAFAEVFQRSGPKTQIVYVGDGAATAGDPDPAAFAARLARAWRGAGTVHAVVPGSTYEALAIDALAALGGGSQRTLDSDPAAAAFELLDEIARPTIKELQLRFEGVEVAAVYPQHLPNLPAGRQQVVVGRFDPRLGDQRGKVLATGTLDGRPIVLEGELALTAGDEGNSFLPRLWARRHLDQLLGQGRDPKTRERIIGLSEEFQIITPYTSFLVLETDADRERFAVRRSMRMRDGEEFFAAGRDAARAELARAQVQRAKGWRRQLRATALAQLRELGRGWMDLLRPGSGDIDAVALGELRLGQRAGSGGPAPGRFDGALGGDARLKSQDLRERNLEGDEVDKDGEQFDEEAFEDEAVPAFDEALQAGEAPATKELARQERSNEVADELSSLGYASGSADFAAKRVGYRGAGDTVPPGFARRAPRPPDPFAGLFPALPATPPRAQPGALWPLAPEAAALAARLDRRSRIAAGEQAFLIESASVTRDARGAERTYRGTAWLGADVWLALGSHVEGLEFDESWLVDGQRCVVSALWSLGRSRPAEPTDRAAWPAPFAWGFGDEFRAHAADAATLEDLGDGRARLTLVAPGNDRAWTELTLDTARAVVLEVAWIQDGKRAWSTTLEGWREVGGMWWPATQRTFDARGRETSSTGFEVAALTPDQLRGAVREHVARVQARSFLLGPDPASAAQAKDRLRAGEATPEDRFLLLRQEAQAARWEAARPHLDALSALLEGKLGGVALRAMALRAERRLEELRRAMEGFLRAAVDAPAPAEVARAAACTALLGDENPGEERLRLLELQRPIYARHAEVAGLMLELEQQVWRALAATGDSERAFAKLAEIARDWPATAWVQANWARELAQRGDIDTALAALEARQRETPEGASDELGMLRAATVDILWNGYRLADLVEACERWERADASTLDANLCDRWLSALAYLGRAEERDARIARWLDLADVDSADAAGGAAGRGPADAATRARLGSAITHRLGGGYSLYSYGGPRWDSTQLEQLVRTARSLAHRVELLDLAGQIVQNGTFVQTDAGRALRRELFGELARAEGLESMPVLRLWSYVQWLRGMRWVSDDVLDDEAAWGAVFRRVLARWERSADPADPSAATTPARRSAERQTLEGILLAWSPREIQLTLRRRALEFAAAAGDAPARAEAAYELSHLLRAGPWTQAVEDELVSLLPRLDTGATVEEAREADLDRRILELFDLCTWLPDARARAFVALLPDVNTLPRRQLAAQRQRLLNEARAAWNERLAGLAFEPRDLALFARVERGALALDAGGDRDVERAERTFAAATLGELLDRRTAATGAPSVRERVLAQRASSVLLWLLSRAGPDQRDESWSQIEGLARRAMRERGEDALLDGRSLLATGLLVLDRPAELEAALAAWSAEGDTQEALRWAGDLARLRAERGDLEGAVAVLEPLAVQGEVDFEDLRALGDWRAALGQDELAREARMRSWALLDPSDLAQRSWQDARSVQRSGTGASQELDAEAFLRLAALLRKAPDPAQHLWVATQLYAPTQDFRVLEGLPEGVIGHTVQGVYPYLQQLDSVFELLHEEAAIDQLRAYLERLRGEARNAADARALALMEFALLRRAADQANGAGPHVEGALAALRAAREVEWQEGEASLMAAFLAAQGPLRPAALAQQQLELLQELRGRARAGLERHQVSAQLARLMWSYGREEEAPRLLAASLDALREASSGRLPPSVNDDLWTLSNWWSQRAAWRAAEGLWNGELALAATVTQRLWLLERLHELYQRALAQGGELSLGRAGELYSRAVDSFLADLGSRTNENHAAGMITILCTLWRETPAAAVRPRSAGDDARRFAFRDLPSVLALYQHRGSSNMIGNVADCLRRVCDARTALEFLVVRAENEPAWLELQGQDFWRQQAWRAAELRDEAGRLESGLEARLLALVLEELRADLVSRENRNRAFYWLSYAHSWREKRADFLQVALDVAAGEGLSSPGLDYVASYLYHGLEAHDEAIDVLLTAYAAKRLEDAAQRNLCRYLIERARFREALAPLQDLVARNPSDVFLRSQWIVARHGAGDAAGAQLALDEARAWFVEHGAWKEDAIAPLAEAAVRSGLAASAVELYGEAIALHEKSAPGRGVGDGVLSSYWRGKSQALAQLGRIDEAIDAASGAIVAWGSRDDQRAVDLENLRQVLARSPDLDATTARLEEGMRRDGLENPILRAALGDVRLRARQFQRAAEQLELALASRPDDLAVSRSLIQAYDQMKRGDLAEGAVLRAARAAAHDVDLWTELARRRESLEDVEGAERARTQLVEALPNESEGYARLAELRQADARWKEAAAAWRQVARVRSGEPTGWIGWARASLRAGAFDDARAALESLREGTWPERFGDVASEVRALQAELERARR